MQMRIKTLIHYSFGVSQAKKDLKRVHTLLKLLETQMCYLYSACLFTLLCCTGQYPNLFASLSPRIALPDQLHTVRSAPSFYSTDSGSSSISGMFPSFSTSNSLAKSSGS